MSAAICHIKFGILAKLSPLLHELARAAESPYEHHVVLPAYNNDAGYLEERYPAVTFHFIDLKSRSMSASRNPAMKLLRYTEFLRKASAVSRSVKAAIYVAHDVTAMVPATRAAKRNGAAMVYRAHELYSEAGREISPLPGLWNKVERYYVGKVEHIVVPEPNRARIYKEEYGARKLPAVVRNIPPVTSEYRKTAYLREQLGLAADDVICLYQGIVTPSRCIKELVESMSHVPERFHLVVIGHVLDDYLNILEDAVRGKALESRVHFLDFIPPDWLPEVTASADLGILLYRNENRNNYYAAPNKIYEYLFAGLPVVTSNFPGLQATVEEHRAGYWADPERPEEIADAIVQASAMEGGGALAERMRKVCRFDDEYAILQTVYNDAQRR